MSQHEILINNEPQISLEVKNEIRNTRKLMMDMLFMMAAPIIMSWYYYGERALRVIVLSALTAVICEYLGSKIFKIYPTISDLSSIVTGIMVALCLPVSAPMWLPCLGSFFAVIVAKLPFGNERSLLFSPVAAAIAFLTLCLPGAVFAYPKILEGAGQLGFVQGDSIAYMLSQKNSIGINIINYIDILIGNVSGPMGATCGFAMIGAMIFLLLRRPKSFIAPACFIISSAVFAFIFPRVMTGRMTSVYMELFGGLLMFCALFIVSNEFLAPKKAYANIAYGIFGGLICMLMRRVSVFEDSTVFAVLILNAVAPAFDKIPFLTRGEKKQIEKTLDREKLLKEKKEQEEKLAFWLGEEKIPDESEAITESSVELSEQKIDDDNGEQERQIQSFYKINNVLISDDKEIGGDENG